MTRKLNMIAVALILSAGGLLTSPSPAAGTLLTDDDPTVKKPTPQYCCRNNAGTLVCCYDTGCKIDSSGCIRSPTLIR